MNHDREPAVARAFVSLASSLVNGEDVVDLLGTLTSTCAELLDIASAGLLLADERGVLHVLAASSEQTRQLELFQLQREQGPCRECFLTGTPVSAPDLARATHRWPDFVPFARAAGIASVHALPLRLRQRVLGALGLFGTVPGTLSEEDATLAQALADVASVALVQDRAASDQAALAEQLQTALSSRVILEQAKGVLAQQAGLDMDDAFAALRGYARRNNLRLTEVARDVVQRRLRADQVPSLPVAEPGGR